MPRPLEKPVTGRSAALSCNAVCMPSELSCNVSEPALLREGLLYPAPHCVSTGSDLTAFDSFIPGGVGGNFSCGRGLCRGVLLLGLRAGETATPLGNGSEGMDRSDSERAKKRPAVGAAILGVPFPDGLSGLDSKRSLRAGLLDDAAATIGAAIGMRMPTNVPLLSGGVNTGFGNCLTYGCVTAGIGDTPLPFAATPAEAAAL